MSLKKAEIILVGSRINLERIVNVPTVVGYISTLQFSGLKILESD